MSLHWVCGHRIRQATWGLWTEASAIHRQIRAPEPMWHAGAVSPPRPVRLALLFLGGAVAAAGATLTTLMLAPEAQGLHRILAMAAAFIPYGILLWAFTAAAFALGATGRRRWVAAFAAIPLLLHVAWSAPYWPHPAPPAEGTPLRVMAANLLFGRAEATSVAAAVRAADPDVIVFTEYGKHVDDRLQPTGLKDAYPYRVGTVASDYATSGRWDASGTQVWSKTPVTTLATAPTTFTQLAVRVERPDGPVVVVAAHPVNMVQGAALWRAEGAALADLARPHVGQRLVVAGDFNATREHVTFREVLALGLTDAVDQAGAGWLPTFDVDTAPLIAIDHVLVDARLVAQRVTTVPIRDTDHLAIVADLVVTR